MDKIVDQHVRGYEIIEQIGDGGFGVVYRALQSGVDREVAVKVILPDVAQQPDFIRRFEAEAQLIARLEHMNIVPLYDYWRDPEGAYLVMRWLRRGSLRDRLNDGALTVEQAGSILTQIGSALMTAHRHNVIHRDIKPSNILLDEEGNAFLTDFGIAKDYNRIDGSTTGTDVIIGSLNYISPEQARSEPVTPRTDIYSLGVVLYEMLTGEHPFPNVSSVERLYKHINDPLPRLTQLPLKIAGRVNQVIQTATAKKPTERYDTAIDFADAFLEAAHLKRQPIPESLIDILTPREQEILQLMINGLSNREIAERLVISRSTVRATQSNLYRKLRVKNRVQAIVRGRELDLLYGEDEITSVDIAEASTSIIAHMPEPENPYKGLRAYQSADSADFYGREKVTEKLIKRLGENGKWSRFLAIIGPSGSGKSSLAKAGVIPAIWRGDLPGSDRWFTVEMLPGSHPIDELEVALRRVSTHPGRLKEDLESDERGLLKATNLILPDDGSELVLVIDQFEEVFTLVEDEAHREHLLDLIVTATSDPRSRVRVIITLRADFYDRPLRYPLFGEMLREQMETVLPLSADELERAIINPAVNAGVKFEDGLVPSIIDDVSYQPGALPLLQYALTELFERRDKRTLTHDAYREMGGTVGALARRAEDLYAEFDEIGQATVRQMFLRLVTLGEGTEDTRRRTPRAELLALGDDRPDLMDELIDTYAAYRLLSLDHDLATRQPMVEVAHEAILREWERLHNWINDSREEIRMQQQIAFMTQEWLDAKRDDSFLASGLRLEQFETWLHQTDLSLSDAEREFLDASKTAEHARRDYEDHLIRRSRNLLRGLVAVFGVAAVIAIGLAIFGLNQSRTASDERDNAQIARATSDANAEISRQQATELQSMVLGNAAVNAFENGDTELALSLAVESASIESPPPEIMSVLERTALGPGTELVLEGHTMPLVSYDISADGRYVLTGAAAISRAYFASQGAVAEISYFEVLHPWEHNPDMAVRMWDLRTGEEIRRFEGHSALPDQSRVVRFGQDEKTVISAACFGLTMNERAVPTCQATEIIIWDRETGEEIHRETVSDIAIDPTTADSSLHVLFIRDNRMWIGNLEDLESTAVALPSNILCFTCVAFSADEATVYVGSPSARSTFDTTTGEAVGEFDRFSILRRNPAILESGTRAIGTDASNQQAILLDLVSGDVLQAFELDGHLINRVVADEDMGLVITSFDGGPPLGGRLGLWDLESGKFLGYLSGHSAPIWGMEILPSGELLTISVDNSARIWGLATAMLTRAYEGHSGGVEDISYSPDGKLAASSTLSSVHIWDLETRETLNILFGPRPQDVAYFRERARFSPDGQAVLTTHCQRSGCGEATAILWDVASGEELQRFGSPDYLNDAIFTPDGRGVLLVGCSEIKTEFSFEGSESCTSAEISLWDVESGEEIRRYDVSDWTNTAAFSVDGNTFYTGSDDFYVRQWNTETGEEIRRFEQGNNWIQTIALSPDETILASRYHPDSGDNTIYLWDVESGQVIRKLEGHAAGGFDIVFTPDGKLLSSAEDGSIILWDVETGNVIRSYTGHTAAVYGIDVAPDGNTFLTASFDATVREWFLNPQAIIEWVEENRYIRPLTLDECANYHIEDRCAMTDDKSG